MGSNSYQPLETLLRLNKEDYKSISLLNLLDRVEKDVDPSPKGRAKRLMLFFYIIDILQSKSISFYVKGGLILQYHLKDRARDTNDIDLLIPNADDFYAQAKEAFDNNAYGLDIKVLNFEKTKAGENYYFPTFHMSLSISFKGEALDKISLDGIYGDLFNEVSVMEYQGPEIIKEGFSFLGIPIEYVFAEKLLAVTSELKRPYKHLVDAYSISQIKIDDNELKKYLKVILSFENITRKKLGISCNKYQYEIKSDKEFIHSYIFAAIQAGYTITSKEMIQYLNQYMSTHLN